LCVKSVSPKLSELSEWMEISGRFGSYARATNVLEVAMESP